MEENGVDQSLMAVAASPQWHKFRLKTYSRRQPLSRCPAQKTPEDVFADLDHSWRMDRIRKELAQSNGNGDHHRASNADPVEQQTLVDFYGIVNVNEQNIDAVDVFKKQKSNVRGPPKGALKKQKHVAAVAKPLLPCNNASKKNDQVNEQEPQLIYYGECPNMEPFVDGKLEYVVRKKRQWWEKPTGNATLNRPSILEIVQEDDTPTAQPSYQSIGDCSSEIRKLSITKPKTTVQTSTPFDNSLDNGALNRVRRGRSNGESLFQTSQSIIMPRSLLSMSTQRRSSQITSRREILPNVDGGIHKRRDETSSNTTQVTSMPSVSWRSIVAAQPRESLMPRFSCERASIDISLTNCEERSFFTSMDSMAVRDKFFDICSQSSPQKFQRFFPENVLKTCEKLGEGSFGEVYLVTRNGRPEAMKVVPIEGELQYNGADQLKFTDVLLEVTVAQKLSNLRNGVENRCSTFMHVYSIHCVTGTYPDRMIKAWDRFAEQHSSQNQNPDTFVDDQLFMMLVGESCGTCLENFDGLIPGQAWSVVWQLSMALAVAEIEMEFEHRDLHCGNVMLQPTAEEELDFVLNGVSVPIPTHGISVTIIDYSLSRILVDGHILYANLAHDEVLFKGEGLQYDVYREMRTSNGNNWKVHNAVTNVQWLGFVCRTLAESTSRRKQSYRDRAYVRRLKKLTKDFGGSSSAVEFVASRYLQAIKEETESDRQWAGKSSRKTRIA